MSRRFTASQGNYLTIERSLYPKELLFKPKPVVFTTVAAALRTYDEVMNQHIPPDPEDVRHAERTGWPPPKKGTAQDRFDDLTTKAWKQVGRYWVRRSDGKHPSLLTQREGSHAEWRNSPDSYCCYGFPYFTAAQMEAFRTTMEMVKPLICWQVGTRSLTLCLERTLEGPIGYCWGIRTEQHFLRFAEDMDNYLSRPCFQVSRAGVKRELQALVSAHT